MSPFVKSRLYCPCMVHIKRLLLCIHIGDGERNGAKRAQFLHRIHPKNTMYLLYTVLYTKAHDFGTPFRRPNCYCIVMRLHEENEKKAANFGLSQ